MSSGFTALYKQLHLTFAGQIEVVPTAADLPTNGQVIAGGARYVADTGTVYTYDGTVWAPIGSGGSASFDVLTANTLIVNNFSYLNSNVVEIGDNIIVLNSEVTGAPTEDGGVAINRGTSPDALIQWNETTDTWEAGTVGHLVPFPGIAPAFKLARQGALATSTWLLADGIPSNLVGHRIGFPDAVLKAIDIDSSSISSFEITVYEHDHIVYTAIATATVSAAYGSTNLLDISVTTGKNLAARVTSGAGNDISVSLILSQG